MNTQLRQSIGQIIKQARKTKGLSQTELGKMLDDPISYQQVQKYENGKDAISFERFVNIGTLLEFNICLQSDQRFEVGLPVEEIKE